jgi:hypothetical protein
VGPAPPGTGQAVGGCVVRIAHAPNPAADAGLGQAVLLATVMPSGACSCPARTACSHPGAHPLVDRWWTSSPSRVAVAPLDGFDGDEAWCDAAGGPPTASAPGVVIPREKAILQVPVALRTVMTRFLEDALLAQPPIIHTDRCSWVWSQLPIPPRMSLAPRRLPDPSALTVLWPGAWIPAPPDGLPLRPGPWWGGQPDADLLSRKDFFRLHHRLAAAGDRLGVRPCPAPPAPARRRTGDGQGACR